MTPGEVAAGIVAMAAGNIAVVWFGVWLADKLYGGRS